MRTVYDVKGFPHTVADEDANDMMQYCGYTEVPFGPPAVAIPKVKKEVQPESKEQSK